MHGVHMNSLARQIKEIILPLHQIMHTISVAHI